MNLTTARDKFIQFKRDKQHRVPGTLENFRQHITGFIRWVIAETGNERLAHMTAENVEAYLNKREREHIGIHTGKRLSPRTIHLTGTLIREFAMWGAMPKQRFWPWEQVAGIEVAKAPRGLPRPYGAIERDGMLEIALDTQDALLRGLLYFAGLRNSEATGLRVRDVMPPTTLPTGQVIPGRLYIFGKGSKERVVDVVPTLWALLDARLKEIGQAPLDQTMLTKSDGGRWSDDMVRQRVHTWAKKAGGVAKPTAHRFRHTFATDLLEANPSELRTVQKILGHASPATTAVYTDVSNERRAAALMRLPGSGVFPQNIAAHGTTDAATHGIAAENAGAG